MWVLLSFSLSLSFVLCNLGLMQGYEESFRLGLREAHGDISLHSRMGFFSLDKELKDQLQKYPSIESMAPLIQTEVFLLHGEHSKAVQLRSYSEVFFSWIHENHVLQPGEVILGQAIATEWGVNIGDNVHLMFARGNSLADALPEVKSFKVVGLHRHLIYTRDARTVYGAHDDVALITNAGLNVNVLLLQLSSKDQNIKSVESMVNTLQESLGTNFAIRPFWYDFSGLLEAVKVEKTMITIALQLIVLVAMFNMISFFRVLLESNYQALFLLRSLGLSLGSLRSFLFLFSIGLWVFANIFSWGWSKLFSWLLANWSLLRVPGKIYQLAQLELSLDIVEYATVAGLSFVWILLLWWWFVRRMGKAELVSVLKGEWR